MQLLALKILAHVADLLPLCVCSCYDAGRMSSDETHAHSLPAAYGRLAARLARAIVGDEETAHAVVRSRAELGENHGDWVAFLASVRSAAVARRSIAAPDETGPTGGLPSPRHPGDYVTQALPVDAALLHEAYFSLAEPDRTVLWSALLGRIDGITPDRLADALARLREAVARASFPSAEDIP